MNSITIGRPRPASEDLVAKASALVPLLRERTRETDLLARLPDATVEDLHRAGFFGLMTPAMYGGLEADLTTYMDVVAEVARGDVSAGWALALISICNWMAATLYPKSVTDEVFAKPGARVAGVLAPRSCKARRVDGGMLVEEGLWMWNSGVYQAQWDLLGIPILNDAGEQVDIGLAVVPIEQVEIVGDWDTIAIRGSGSSSVRMKNVFVPDERIASLNKAILGEYGGTHVAHIPLYRAAFMPLLTVILSFPEIGAGQAALDLFLQGLPKRGIIYTWYTKQAEAAVTHLQVGEASAKADAARTIVAKICTDLQAAAEAQIAGEAPYMDVLTRARIRRDTGLAGKLVWEAVDELASAAGGSLAGTHNPLNRVWRDARIAILHGVFCPTTNYELYGRMACGQVPNTNLV